MWLLLICDSDGNGEMWVVLMVSVVCLRMVNGGGDSDIVIFIVKFFFMLL